MIARGQIVQLAQECGFTTGEYNAGDGSGAKIPFVAFDGINMLAALERFIALAYTAWHMAPAPEVSTVVDEWLERELFMLQFESKYGGYKLGPRQNNCGLVTDDFADTRVQLAFEMWQAGRAALRDGR